MLKAVKLDVGYGGEPVLRGVDFEAGGNEVVGLVGPNGSGKTTLLRSLYRSLVPVKGTVTLDGSAIGEFSTLAIARRIAVVAQEGAAELPFTVAEMVMLGRSPHRSAFQGYSRLDAEAAADALACVGARHLGERAFGTLSGGEKQRVLIARAVAQQTDHLLLDEPTNHLDIRYQHEILQIVRSLAVSTVVVLHDLNLAARYCDKVVLLEEGRVSCVGTPREVLTPTILEPIYGVGVRCLDDRGVVQLLFSPAREFASNLSKRH